MSTYQRATVAGGCYFFTVNLALRRDNNLLLRHIADLRRAFRVTRRDHPFSIEAIMVLPDICIAYGSYRRVMMIFRPDGG